MPFPDRRRIFSKSILDARQTVGRPSIDTLFQVHFDFGNHPTWLESSDEVRQFPTNERRRGIFSGGERVQGSTFTEKMSLLCAEAEIPGTSFQTSLAVGHHQGIQEEFPNLRTFPPLNLTFYVDLDHVILEVLESWMTYINPISARDKRVSNAYGRFNYPEDYKETIHVSKFERDLNTDNPTTRITSYEFIKAWPTNLTSMRVAYGESNVLRCSIQLAYDRFFAEFNYNDTNGAVTEDAFTSLSTLEQARRNGLRDEMTYGTTFPSNSYGVEKNSNSYSTKDRKENRH